MDMNFIITVYVYLSVFNLFYYFDNVQYSVAIFRQ